MPFKQLTRDELWLQAQKLEGKGKINIRHLYNGIKVS